MPLSPLLCSGVRWPRAALLLLLLLLCCVELLLAVKSTTRKQLLQAVPAGGLRANLPQEQSRTESSTTQRGYVCEHQCIWCSAGRPGQPKRMLQCDWLGCEPCQQHARLPQARNSRLPWHHITAAGARSSSQAQRANRKMGVPTELRINTSLASAGGQGRAKPHLYSWTLSGREAVRGAQMLRLCCCKTSCDCPGPFSCILLRGVGFCWVLVFAVRVPFAAPPINKTLFPDTNLCRLDETAPRKLFPSPALSTHRAAMESPPGKRQRLDDPVDEPDGTGEAAQNDNADGYSMEQLLGLDPAVVDEFTSLQKDVDKVSPFSGVPAPGEFDLGNSCVERAPNALLQQTPCRWGLIWVAGDSGRSPLAGAAAAKQYLADSLWSPSPFPLTSTHLPSHHAPPHTHTCVDHRS